MIFNTTANTTLKNLSLSSCLRQKQFMSLMTEINLALLHMASILLSGHTSWVPKIIKSGFSDIYLSLSSFKWVLRAFMVVSSTLRTATLLFFLGVILPTCRTSSLPPSLKHEGLHTIQHKEFWCSMVPPNAVTTVALIQFSVLTQVLGPWSCPHCYWGRSSEPLIGNHLVLLDHTTT